MRSGAIASVAAVLTLGASSAGASTATTSFQVQLTIQSQCLVVSASTLSFGTQGVLTANIDQTSTVQAQCTNTTPYNIGLDAGTGTGATVASRKLTSGVTTISYSLYSDSARTTVWGNTIGVNTVAATGNGAVQSYTVYGRIPPQTTPAPGSYSDTITMTVTY